MPQTPQRPFVPQSTPSGSRASARPAKFHLRPPFVHGEARVGSHALPSISEFLDASPITGAATQADNGLDFTGDAGEDDYEIPPIEHFMDPPPSGDLFGSDVPGGPAGFEQSGAGVAADQYVQEAEAQLDESGWEDAGWQQFDWSGAAALGEAPDPAAADAWSRTEWDTQSPPAEERETPAQAIASALDQIAHRIRRGEIIVPPADLAKDPAAIAATLAALLGVRR